jgi:hypothetical protein
MRIILMPLALLAMCVVLAGCGVAYHQNATNLAQTAKEEDYGPMPTDHENAVKSFMETVLIDPESARYSNWDGPRRSIIRSTHFGTEPILGWQVDVYINSKNRMGGYVGAKKMGFFFVNNKVYAYSEYSSDMYWWYYPHERS